MPRDACVLYGVRMLLHCIQQGAEMTFCPLHGTALARTGVPLCHEACDAPATERPS